MAADQPDPENPIDPASIDNAAGSTGPGRTSNGYRVVELTGDPITDLDTPTTVGIEAARDRVRAILAIGLLALLSAIVLLGFLLIAKSPGAPTTPSTPHAIPASNERNPGGSDTVGPSQTPSTAPTSTPAVIASTQTVVTTPATHGTTFEARTMFVQSMLSVVAGLFGAATGFYFGSSQHQTKQRP
ncbi:hypothetical protein [Nocardioides sp. 1609]|uniref:hypothetical protein n=1 Tax=Nocardioides sp. 1609 TaxID=2508327 RepID=UPI00106FC7D4|nr:hypothetical protein [Nocardioides sp. 1609]